MNIEKHKSSLVILKMEWVVLTIIVLDILVILTHTLALVLLFSVRQNNVQGSQKTLLIALCMTELTYIIINMGELFCRLMKLGDVANVLFILCLPCLLLLYVFIMFLITIDRFLEIYLNIKYRILWTTKKTKLLLLFALTISFLSFAPSYLSGLKKVIEFVNLYISPILEGTFIVTASVVYIYIVKQAQRHRRSTKRLRRQLEENNIIVHYKERNNRFKIVVPTIIIVTFVFFMVGANSITLFASFKNINSNVKKIPLILIPAGFVADSIIYIFNLKAVRSTLRKKILGQNNAHFPL